MSIARLAPEVQQIQQSAPFIDTYTDAATTLLRARPVEQHATLTMPHAHPPPKRWTSPRGWGARHINDDAPFNLWDEAKRDYRFLKKGAEYDWCRDKFGDGQIASYGWFMTIDTKSPPKPVPLTVGCMPVIFTNMGEKLWSLTPKTCYANPRVSNPCPEVQWERMTSPTKDQNIAILTALEPLANVRAIIYMPHWTIVELEYGDGRVYQPGSLPGTVGVRTTLYHHEEEPFYKTLSKMTCHRRLDPTQQSGASDPTPQDTTNYIQECAFVSPGCRLESGLGMVGSQNERVNAATSAGVKLWNINGKEALTVSHHGFLNSKEVYHPFASGVKIGEVFDERPELDISLVELVSDVSRKFRNDCYFQGETPKLLLRGSDIVKGSWFEVDGMSSGLVSLLTYAKPLAKPSEASTLALPSKTLEEPSEAMSSRR
ncbi:hypothetical protein GMDG_01998 [Pseudogymnoascus destructans 20631-21]|uniref:Uncharacterized protein n=1 Tax=Pseudogymnoascus destructans (strain ATCC MYA-4855 / 20631-21) TaxID=658429 RepID=L8G039_PSED2|nr:hypothetical protein GMDG_01998 [Pseudogymnoascus destructans 20631-21]